MKIVRKGKLPPPPKPVVYGGTCDHCGCEVEVDDKDTAIITEAAGNSRFNICCICPTKGCYRQIDLEVSAMRGVKEA